MRAAALVNESEELEQNLLVALGDDHYLIDPAGPEILDLLRCALSIHHRGCVLVRVSRRIRPCPIASLRARGHAVGDPPAEDLRFSPARNRRVPGPDNRDTCRCTGRRQPGAKDRGLGAGAAPGRRCTGAERTTQRPVLLALHGACSYTLDYLVPECDRPPPAEIRDLLLATSVLGRFCAPLCDALREQSGGEAPERLTGLEFITWLRSNNLFIIPLDTENRWFRYHHLFQDLLKHQLALKISPEEIAELHLRAFAWCEQEGLIEEAIQLRALGRRPRDCGRHRRTPLRGPLRPEPLVRGRPLAGIVADRDQATASTPAPDRGPVAERSLPSGGDPSSGQAGAGPARGPPGHGPGPCRAQLFSWL